MTITNPMSDERGYVNNRLVLPIPEIIKAYEVDKQSLNNLGMKYGTSADIIKSRLIEAGIQLRTKRECYDLNRENFYKWWRPVNPKTPAPIANIPKQKPVSKKALKIRRFEIFARDGFRCRYCGRTPQEDGVKLVIEHIIAKSQGGDNNSANLITACYNCNISKGKHALVGKNRQIPSFIAITVLR